MTVGELRERLCLRTAYQPINLNKRVYGCYVGDYLSNAMNNAKAGNIFITVVNNSNIVAVAMLRQVSCIILCENTRPDKEALQEAINHDIPILLTKETAYEMAVRISKVIKWKVCVIVLLSL